MKLPDDYLDALSDELAPFGFEFAEVSEGPEAETVIRFEAEPDAFIRRYPWTEIDAAYGDEWPPPALELWIRVDDRGDFVEISFEVFDILLWAAADAPDLAGRLATLNDPEDQATALGQAFYELLNPPMREADSMG